MTCGTALKEAPPLENTRGLEILTLIVPLLPFVTVGGRWPVSVMLNMVLNQRFLLACKLYQNS